MTIDERLDRLTERHEALLRMLKSLAARRRQHEEEWSALQRQSEERFAGNEELFARNGERLAQLTDAIDRLVRLVELHGYRVDTGNGG